MTNSQISTASAIFLGLVSLGILVWWLSYDPSQEFAVFEPGADNEPVAQKMSGAQPVQIGEHFKMFDSSIVSQSSSWPRFRGADFKNISRKPIDLTLPLDLERQIVWSLELGEGHAGPAIHDGRLYLLDYDETSKSDALRCFALSDGRELWQRSYTVKIKRNHGISRTTPAVTDEVVVSIGPRCHVMGVDPRSGDYLWGLDLVKNYGVTTPLWYTGQCPLIDGTTVVIATGGETIMMGVDARSGNIVWETQNPRGWKMSHSSIIPMTLHGKRQYVYCADGGMLSVSAEPEDIGQVLWETTLWNHKVTAPSPLELKDGKVFVTAGYSAGGMLLQVSKVHDGYAVDSLRSVLPHQGLASEQQTPIYTSDFIYGIMPKDAGTLNGQFACFASDDISRVIWSSGKEKRFGLGPYILVDDKFLILDDDGILTIIEASATHYNELAQLKILPGPDAWAPLAVVDGKLLARDSHRMICLDLGGKGAPL